jgi:hypothetical protein
MRAFVYSGNRSRLWTREVRLAPPASMLLGSSAGLLLGCAVALYDSGADFRALCACGTSLAFIGLLIGITGWLLSDSHRHCMPFRVACALICSVVFLTLSLLGFWDSRLWEWAEREIGLLAAIPCIGFSSMPFCLLLGAIWGTILGLRTVGCSWTWNKPSAVSLSDGEGLVS